MFSLLLLLWLCWCLGVEGTVRLLFLDFFCFLLLLFISFEFSLDSLINLILFDEDDVSDDSFMVFSPLEFPSGVNKC